MASAPPTGSLFLALDSSGPIGSVAVAAGADVLARRTLDRPMRFSAELIPAVAAVLEEAGVARTDLAGVVVGSGPGSFTGVRVAAATAKGLAHALAIPMWAFSSLEAAAVADGAWGVRYVLFDARGDRVYAACYEVGPAGVEERVAPHASSVGAVLLEELPLDVAFVGDGAVRHAGALRAAGRRVLAAPAGIPTADALLALRALGGGRVPVDRPDRWEPDYVKASNAERARTG